jgi:hypothetical protein
MIEADKLITELKRMEANAQKVTGEGRPIADIIVGVIQILTAAIERASQGGSNGQ